MKEKLINSTVTTKVVTTTSSTLADFLAFLREQGVIGLAIAVVLGAAVTKLVGAFVTDIINPVIGVLLGAAGDLSSYSLKLGKAEIMWGHFLTVFIDFIVVAAVVYIMIKFLKIDSLDKKKT